MLLSKDPLQNWTEGKKKKNNRSEAESQIQR